MITLSFKERFPVSSHVLFNWHEMPGAFLRLNPPFEPVELISHTGGIKDGAQVKIKIPILGPIGIFWSLTHTGYVAGEKFEDHQVKGPFKSWQHRHLFKAISETESELHDEIQFSLPFSILSEPLFGWLFKRKLTKLFHFRHQQTKCDLTVIERYKNSFPLPQRYLISGASGFVGKSLVSFLLTAGHSVSILSRKDTTLFPSEVIQIPWDPYQQELDSNAIEGFDHIIHLSGENVASRWSEKIKKRIIDSRVVTTLLLAETVKQLTKKPDSFISASGVGFYGTHTNSVVDENSPQGDGFLAEVVRLWENALSPLKDSSVRTYCARFGIILSPDGGALKKLIIPFMLGIGGPIGMGRRMMSCISKSDVVYGLYHLTASKTSRGPINFCVPTAVSNLVFSQTLARILKRPCVAFVPPFILKIIFGKMADETILTSQNVSPKSLKESGFSFSFPSIESILRFVTGN